MSKSNRFFEALEAERETYGTPNVLHDIGYINGLTMAKIIAIKTDAVSVVRCKDCKHYKTITCSCGCHYAADNWYCADGERKDNDL